MTATDVEEELTDVQERLAAARLLDSQRLFVSVAKRNSGKGLLCEPPKVATQSSLWHHCLQCATQSLSVGI